MAHTIFYSALLLVVSLTQVLSLPTVPENVFAQSGGVDDAASLEKRDSLPDNYIQSPPYYPAPPGGWHSSWAASYAKANLVVANMTLAEKVNLTTGTGYLMVRPASPHSYHSSII